MTTKDDLTYIEDYLRGICDFHRVPQPRLSLQTLVDGSVVVTAALALAAVAVEIELVQAFGGEDWHNWRNASFRAYADYMQTPPFLDGLGRLVEEAGRRRVAVMCAEAVPWRCHRSLIADAMLVRGWAVLDVMSVAKATPHKLTPFARVDGTRVTYPPEQPELFG